MTNTTPLPERSQIDARPAAGHESTAAVAMASAKQVREFTGQAIGGVAPIGHPAPVRTVIDAALRDYETLWAAARTPATPSCRSRSSSSCSSLTAPSSR